ncbi:MAG: hypothetical protein ISS01_00610 [Nanoarchaeota archaeon]|nr:hypothetical protein [Nanoarchaeota archaeon]
MEVNGKKYDREVLMAREDIRALVEMPDGEYLMWHSQRKDAIVALLSIYELAGSVPSLLNPESGEDMSRQYSGKVDALRRSLDYLDVIVKLKD